MRTATFPGPGRPARRRPGRGALAALFTCTLLGALLMLGPNASAADATTFNGFEIDADTPSPPEAALYSGTGSPAGDDWAQGSSQQGLFTGRPAGPGEDGCYGSVIEVPTSTPGVTAVICDGNSDSRFRTLEPEQNIVSPAGKTPDDQWPIRPGNVRPKNDLSHAYGHARIFDSPCDADTTQDDILLAMGGHRGDNEGDAFWGFEFDRVAPGGFNQLIGNTGATFTLDYNRTARSGDVAGDLFVSFTVRPGETQLELFEVTGFSDGDAVFSPVSPLAGCAPGADLDTNDGFDVTAPPWNVPVCDPTADNSANTCRLANGTTPTEDLLASRDFAEAAIDLTAFGIQNVCVSSMLFSSRSAHVLEGADIQDVGGASFPLCGAKSGAKFEDLNADGDRDTGEPGLAGWTINLFQDADGDGVLDPDESATPFRTDVTDADGNYRFEDLFPGTYIVCEVLQDGWTQSRPFTGMPGLPAGETVTDCPGNTKGYAYTQGVTEFTGNDFGNFQPGVIQGVKFKDKDDDGIDRESGEPGLSGWTVIAFSGTSEVARTTTDADGAFSFTLNPGTYTVCEKIGDQAGWRQSFPTGTTAGSADCSGLDDDADPSTPSQLAARGWSVTVTSQSTTTRNFGNAPTSRVSVTFESLADLPDGSDATHATSISCSADGTSLGSNTNSNTFTSDATRLAQGSTITCTITYEDP